MFEENFSKNKCFILFVTIFVLCVSGQVKATTTYSPWLKIEQIRVGPGGEFNVYTDIVVDSACTNSGKFFRIGSGYHTVDELGQKSLLSTALHAFATGLLVQAFVDTATNLCYAKLIDIKKE